MAFEDSGWKFGCLDDGDTVYFKDAPAPAKVVSDGGSTPDLYGLPANARDIDDLISARKMTFRQGNIFKATWRIGRKAGNDDAYDLRKIIFNAQRELEKLEGKSL